MSRFATANVGNGGTPLPRWAVKRRRLEALAECTCILEGVNFYRQCQIVSDFFQQLETLPRIKYRTPEQQKLASTLIERIAAHKMGRRLAHEALQFAEVRS